MKKLFIIIIVFTCFSSTAQNLVPNPSFELYSSCPINDFETSRLLNWFSPIYPNNMPASSFFEFGVYNVCSPYYFGINNAAIPQNFGGFEQPFSGSSYIKIILGAISNLNGNFRSYCSVKMNNPLTTNKFYKFSLMYSSCDSNAYDSRNFGVLISDTAVNHVSLISNPNPYILPFDPQLKVNKFLSKRVGWEKLEWIYKANGTENYITLGNYKTNNNDDMLLIYPQTPYSYGEAAIYIDDVVVEPYNCATGLVKDTTLCNKEIINLQLANNALASYAWQDGTVGANYTITNAGTYWVTTIAQGCVATDTIKVKYKTATPFSLGGNRGLCNAQMLTLQVPNIYNSYFWQNGTTNNSLIVKDSGLYYVTATEGKCTYTDTAKITKINCVCDPQIPTAFTPNNDNKNDLFGPVLNCAVKNYSFIIYNRYGQVVFTSTSPAVKWNGNFNNAASPMGSYVYSLQYSLQNDVVFNEKGTVLLVE